MNRALHNITALLLTVWYVVCVIGFDLHFCSRTGENYVATFISGLECADIHPGECASSRLCCCHACDSMEACHDSDGHAPELEASECCTDEYQVLALTGSRSFDDSRGADEGFMQHCVLFCSHDLDALFGGLSSFRYLSGDAVFLKPLLQRLQALLSVWRI